MGVSYGFILKKLSKLVSGLVTMGVALPVVRHVVDVRKDHFEQLLWTKHHVLVRNKRPNKEKKKRKYFVIL